MPSCTVSLIRIITFLGMSIEIQSFFLFTSSKKILLFRRIQGLLCNACKDFRTALWRENIKFTCARDFSIYALEKDCLGGVAATRVVLSWDAKLRCEFERCGRHGGRNLMVPCVFIRNSIWETPSTHFSWLPKSISRSKNCSSVLKLVMRISSR